MAIEPNEKDKALGMMCWCGSLLHLDVENEQYICVTCGKSDDECECEYH